MIKRANDFQEPVHVSGFIFLAKFYIFYLETKKHILIELKFKRGFSK